MFKEQKGITLVALVITIIVLLILAGVSISLVVGQDGVLGKAQSAVSSTEKATAGQEIELSISEAQMAYMEAWTKDQSTNKLDYYKTPDFYHRNCVSTSTDNVKVYSGKGTDNSNMVYITYKSKSNVTYLASFDVTAPSTTYQMLSPDVDDPKATNPAAEPYAALKATIEDSSKVVETPTSFKPSSGTTSGGSGESDS